jgi:hypothetical protein
MAFIKLLPTEGRDALAIGRVVERLREEFEIVHVDADEGQDHVAGMIAATLRFSDDLPGKQERLQSLQSVQKDAVYVTFGDDLRVVASCCILTGWELFFDSPEELHGAARPLVERAARALDYIVYEG